VKRPGRFYTLRLEAAGVVGSKNDNESHLYQQGFYQDRIHINGRHVTNINEYVHQEETEHFLSLKIAVRPGFIKQGTNTLTISSTRPYEGQHDDFDVRYVRLEIIY